MRKNGNDWMSYQMYRRARRGRSRPASGAFGCGCLSLLLAAFVAAFAALFAA